MKAGKALEKVIHSSRIPDGEDMERAVKELVEKLSKQHRKLGPKAAAMLEFKPLAHCVSSIHAGFMEGAEWIEGPQAKECVELQAEGEDHSLTVHIKVRVPITRRLDLLDAVIESYSKAGADNVEKAMKHILARTQMPFEAEKAVRWWKSHFGEEMVLQYDWFFREYFSRVAKRVAAQKGEKGVEEWKVAISHCIDYTQDQTVTAYEFAFFCLWWYPGSPSPYYPRSLCLLLQQGYFQAFADRRNFHKFVKRPGEYFVRNTINQGGGWCVSYIDSYGKPKHTLLVLKTEHQGGPQQRAATEPKGGPFRGWEFQHASSPERATAVSVVAIVQKNTDHLQIACGARYEGLPTIEWDADSQLQLSTNVHGESAVQTA